MTPDTRAEMASLRPAGFGSVERSKINTICIVFVGGYIELPSINIDCDATSDRPVTVQSKL